MIRAMRVCVDIQSAVAQRAGVGRYTRSLVEALARTRAPDDRLRLFHFDFRRRGEPFRVTGSEDSAIRWIPGRWAQKAWKTVGWPPFDAFSGPSDVFHFPNFIRPPLRRGRSVVTIHDISFLRYPEAAEARNLKYLTARIRDTVARADRILADCAFVADEIVEHLGAERGRVVPVHPGLSGRFAPADPDAVRAVRERHGLQRPYLLTVGTLEPRKNHAFLFDVFERMRGFDGDLALVGMKGWKVAPILERMTRSSASARIRRLDYVADEDLPALYTGAELFLFPSLYEGFGFPPLEAMACGCPVLASTAEALVETLGEGADLMPTADAEAWAARALSRIAGAGRAEWIRRGHDWARRYDWDVAARKVWSVYREAAAS